MKKLLAMMLMASTAVTISAGRPISRSQLPKAARTFISKHFSTDKIYKIEVDGSWYEKEYEVDLMSGAEIEFRADGSWKEVKASRGRAVPAGIVPAAISKYVKANFADMPIVEIQRKAGGYEVELANGTELKLTADAQPLMPPSY